jgi:hypothetical protein
LASEERALIVIMPGWGTVTFPASNPNFGRHKCNDDLVRERVVARWLITQYVAYYQQGMIRLFPRHDKWLAGIVERAV